MDLNCEFMLISMIGLQRIFLQTVDSTNNYAAKLQKEGLLRHGTVILAEEQTQGRGQRGNVWHTGHRKQFISTVYLETAFLSVHYHAFLNKAIALSVHHAIRSCGISSVVIKWPNDLLVANKKIGGILIEGILEGNRIKGVLVGVGVNLESSEVFRATSFEEEGIQLQAKQFLDHWMDQLIVWFELLKKSDFQTIDNEYHRQLWRWNEEHDYLINEQQLKGILRKVNSEGNAEIELNGTMEAFGIQQIQFIY